MMHRIPIEKPKEDIVKMWISSQGKKYRRIQDWENLKSSIVSSDIWNMWNLKDTLTNKLSWQNKHGRRCWGTKSYKTCLKVLDLLKSRKRAKRDHENIFQMLMTRPRGINLHAASWYMNCSGGGDFSAHILTYSKTNFLPSQTLMRDFSNAGTCCHGCYKYEVCQWFFWD